MSKVWLITGAGSGIGAETARAALKAGDRVVATGRNPDKVRSALSDVAGENLAVVALDVANEAQAKAAVGEAVQRFGRIDVLVNNAGYSLAGLFEELTTAQIEQQFATNFYGVVHLMHAVLPVMRQQRSGHILNISSVAGVLPMKNTSAYAATKFAVEGLSLSMAHEVERFGIRITVVEPGYFRTDLVDARNVKFATNKVADYADEQDLRQIMASINGQQQGDPAKLGEVLVGIVSMENPPKIFAAGSDALTMIMPAIEARLRDMKAHEALSKSTDGQFQDRA
jgi:NAD(P)-dependent dehydrogenase (short-subunit alcohol dehydrogenase family)